MGIDNEEKHIKCIHFDFLIDEIREHFSNDSTPYTQIQNFLENNGFEHNQYSGYISKEPLNDAAVYTLLRKIAKNFTWIDDCVRKFAITNAPDEMEVQGFLSQNARNEMKGQFKELQNEINYYKRKRDILLPDARKKSEDKIIKLYETLHKHKFMQTDEYKNTFDFAKKIFQVKNNTKSL